ncbi:hypothetical protein K443DRAFT_482751 [Laccaria amethystina LaAM-08-1]|uniref:Uncharacterized protein n=1 Tax=Laccaria amethystina LaAM-08-1 TaxID=1095629 RepID=A0A0C9WHN3_9AGAR|nr:hypothetical protein K443DRAFT_482751 [Laccaria amethystina LaAM-08-1]
MKWAEYDGLSMTGPQFSQTNLAGIRSGSLVSTNVPHSLTLSRTTPPPTPPHTRTSPTTVFYGPACSSTTPSHLAQQTSTHPSPRLCKSTLSRRGLDENFAFPLLSKQRRFALPAYNLQSSVECNGDEFNVVLYPCGRFELLLFQMPMQAEASNLRHHRGSDANSP